MKNETAQEILSRVRKAKAQPYPQDIGLPTGWDRGQWALGLQTGVSYQILRIIEILDSGACPGGHIFPNWPEAACENEEPHLISCHDLNARKS